MKSRSLLVYRTRRRALSVIALFFLTASFVLGNPPLLMAQATQSRIIPTGRYFGGLELLYRGDYRDALKVLEDELRGAIHTPQTRWIDSICYHTMMGEAYYNVGDLDRALKRYDSALKLFASHSDWMMIVQFRDLPRTNGPISEQVLDWGRSSRRTQAGDFRNTTMLISRNRPVTEPEKIKLGILMEASWERINAIEILRCTTLAMRRRTEILGPITKFDPLTSTLLERLSRRPAKPGHWSGAWIDLQLGLAYRASGNPVQAQRHLLRSLSLGGTVDHPLTSIALVELGKLSLEANNLKNAAIFFHEASILATIYPDPIVLEEAFRYGLKTHLMANGKGVYPPLQSAATWVGRKRKLRQLQSALLLMVAENYSFLGKGHVVNAQRYLDLARAAMNRSDNLGSSYLAARLNYMTAQVAYQSGRLKEGNLALDAALKFQKQGSMRLYQVAVADELYRNSGLLSSDKLNLFDELLKDPNATDWVSDPFDSLTFLLTPHQVPLNHWFDLAVNKEKFAKALEISDLARRHRFYSTLPLGGRLLSLRWTLDASPGALSERASQRRDSILARYPIYGELSKKAQDIQKVLDHQPLVNEPGKAFEQQSVLFAQLAKISMTKELMLREIALRREPSSYVFPQVLRLSHILKRLPERHAILTFYGTDQHLQGFLISKGSPDSWRIKSPQLIQRNTVTLLQAMGNHTRNRELNSKLLTDQAWKKPAREIYQLLTQGCKSDLAKDFDELIIVPHGLLWYVPFEALQVPDGKDYKPLISKVRIRFAPTLSLAVSDRRGRAESAHTAVVLGKLFPRDDAEVAKKAFDKIRKALPGTVAIKTPLPAPSPLFAKMFDRLIVLNEIETLGGGPYSWSPMPMDRSKATGALANWFALPWGGPDQVILPGFHTPAENSLKGLNLNSAGDEIFLPLCGLMATGTRTVLISRWRVGGQSSINLVKEFVQELPHTSAAQAWQRSIDLSMDMVIDSEAEPRVKTNRGNDVQIKADHPFFWAGYLLIDTGFSVQEPKKKIEKPKLDFDKLKKTRQETIDRLK